ncbi:hypothetical protein N431DRAFT_414386 [Stipitochalara longipes BDJ]|nr:hypothetical protein N431DRAFT_414386 [Stipitochalara longipes BDJ]
MSHQKGGAGGMPTNSAMQQQVDPPSGSSDSGMDPTIASSGVISATTTRLLKPVRRRTQGACTNCRLRRTRCDAVSSGILYTPCTNCTAFSLQCTGSTRQPMKMKESEMDTRYLENKVRLVQENGQSMSSLHPMQLLEKHLLHEADDANLYVNFLKPEFRHAPIIEPGRIAYLGESSNLPLLVDEDPNSTGIVHYQLPENFKDSRAKLSRMENTEIEMLRQRGALSLPAWRTCDDLVQSYFKWIAPFLPVINQSRFMRQYKDPNDPPSLLLLQAVFLAGSTVSRTGSTATGAAFYKKAKALYDAGYEDDRIVTIQALVLIGWYWERSGDHAEVSYYWNGLAITVALGSGIHRSAERSPLSNTDKRLWRRIWWTLFVRDRSAALRGHLVQIHTDDSDIEMVCEGDFIEEGYPPDPIRVQFFLQYVKLCIIIGAIPSLHNSTPLRANSHSVIAAVQFEKALLGWSNSCPKELKWEEASYNFWSASLYCSYKAALSLVHAEDLRLLPVGDNLWMRQPFEGPRHLVQWEYLGDQPEAESLYVS